jgi:hypothetical protein
MTVKQLIEKLQSLNPNDEIVIELNHDMIVPLHEKSLQEERLTKDYCHASEEDIDTKRVVTIREQRS